eukprot:gene22322-29397_t
MVALSENIIRAKTRLEKIDDVRTLNLWGQDLGDISLIQKMPNLEVVSLSVNNIDSLRDFRFCTGLQELYLRKNNIADLADIRYLAGHTSLHTLLLSDNPCAGHPYYRQIIARALPCVQKLDNTEITPLEREDAHNNPEILKYMGGVPSETGVGGNPFASYDQPPPTPGVYQPPPTPGGYQQPPPYQEYQPQQYAPQPAAYQPDYNSPTGVGGPRSFPPPPPVQVHQPQQVGFQPGGGSMGGGAGSTRKNLLYAVMALIPELGEEDLIYVKREIEQRLSGR